MNNGNSALLPGISQGESSAIDSRPTGTSGLVNSSRSAPTPISALTITENARELVARARSLNSDVANTHTDALANELSVRTQQHTRNAVSVMLNELANMGFSWRDLARVLKVSVPALQKWRKGEGVSGENRRKVATLMAGLDVIASQFTVQNIESWFETPITDYAPVTPVDLWADGRYLLVLRYASDQMTADQVLDDYEPNWREKWQSEFAAFRGDDGNISIGRRS